MQPADFRFGLHNISSCEERSRFLSHFDFFEQTPGSLLMIYRKLVGACSRGLSLDRVFQSAPDRCLFSPGGGNREGKMTR